MFAYMMSKDLRDFLILYESDLYRMAHYHNHVNHHPWFVRLSSGEVKPNEGSIPISNWMVLRMIPSNGALVRVVFTRG